MVRSEEGHKECQGRRQQDRAETPLERIMIMEMDHDDENGKGPRDGHRSYDFGFCSNYCGKKDFLRNANEHVNRIKPKHHCRQKLILVVAIILVLLIILSLDYNIWPP